MTELTIGTSVHVHMGRSDYDGEVIDAWQPNGAASAYYDVRDDKTGRIIFGVAGHQISDDNADALADHLQAVLEKMK